MRTIGAALLVVSALAGAARADDVTIRVDDLLRASRPEKDLRFLPWPDPTGELCSAEEPGEPVVPLDSESLAKVVSFLSGGVEVRFVDSGVHIACAAETAELVRAAVARLRAQRPARVDVDFTLTTAAAGGTATVLAARESIEPREWFTVADVGLRGSLTDFDVEIAESSEIADPILQLTRSGSYVRLRVLPLPSSAEAVVELDAVVVEPLEAQPMAPGWTGMAPMDRVRSSVERTVVPIRIRSGEPAVCEWTGRDGRRVTLRLTGTWKPAPVDANAAILWSPLVTSAIRYFWFLPESVSSRGEVKEEQPRFDTATHGVAFVSVDEVLAGDRTETVAAGGTGLLAFRGPSARTACDAVVARLREATRSARVSLVAWDVPRGTDVPADGSVPAGAREVFRAAAPALLGHNAVFHSAEATTYLSDWDVEVAQAARIADPVVGTQITGSFANLTLLPGPGGAPASGVADVDMLVARSEGFTTQSVDVLVPTGWAAGDAGSAGGKVPALQKTSYVLEKPRVRQTRVRTRLALSDAGVGVTRRTLPGLLGPDRELVVVVRAE